MQALALVKEYKEIVFKVMAEHDAFWDYELDIEQ